MARIFIGHSSDDNAEAIALRDWIIENGWDETPFLDLDARDGIPGGEHWERALNEAAYRCEAVLFLVSRAWLGSDWCQREYNLARRLNKRLFGVLIEDIPLADLPVTLTGTWQVVNLAAGNDHTAPIRTELPDLSRERHVTFSQSGLDRLKAGLDNAGLDPGYFTWPPPNDPSRSPYPGLRPLEAGDAGIFFGRDAPLLVALDQLRGLGEAGSGGVFVIQGASGAGKSSFLRAGLWPRLRRDALHFLPLPVVRPRTAAISGDAGWVQCLHDALRTARLAVNRGAVTAAVNAGAAAVARLLLQIVEKVRLPPELGGPAKPPTLILPIDQAEELFLAEGAEEATSFLRQLEALVTGGAPSVIAVFTIRSDSYEKLQTAPELAGLRQQTYPLPPMPRGSYRSIIVEPALRLARTDRKFKVQPVLVDALLTDIERDGAKDSLPLLAFTLTSLYQEVGGQSDLTLAAYESIGRLGGAIDAAIAGALKAADSDGTIPRNADERMALLHRALIPALARIDPDTGQPQRLVARFEDIPKEAQALVRCLVNAHLLVTDHSPTLGTETIEPAHETLLRQWKALSEWLQDDSQALRTLDRVQGSAAEWAHNDRTDKWLTHEAGRLEDAEALLRNKRFAASFGAVDRSYLDACRQREKQRADEALAAKQREVDAQKRNVRNTRLFSGVAAAIALVAAGLALWGWREAENAEMQATAARMKVLAIQSRRLASEGDIAGNIELASALALESIHIARNLNLAPEADAIETARDALNQLPIEIRSAGPSLQSLLSLADGRLVSVHTNGQIKLWPTDPMSEPTIFQHLKSRAFADLKDGRLAIGDTQGRIRLWPMNGAGEETILEPGHSSITSLLVLRDGRLVSGDSHGKIKVWPQSGGEGAFSHGEGSVMALLELTDGRLVSADSELVKLWPKDGLSPPLILRHKGANLRYLVELDGGKLASGSYEGDIWIWRQDGSGSPATLKHGGDLVSLTKLADGRLVSVGDRDIKFWPSNGKGEPVVLRHGGQIMSFAVLNDGRLVSGRPDGQLKFWRSNTLSEPLSLQTYGNPEALAVLKDGRLVSGGSEAIEIWQKDGQGAPLRLDGKASRIQRLNVRSLAGLPDGRLASGTLGGEILLWSLAKPEEPPTVLRHGTRDVWSLVVLPDGRLASGGEDGEIKVWSKEGRSRPVTDQATGDAIRLLSALTDGRLAFGTKNTIEVRPADEEGKVAFFRNDSLIIKLTTLPNGLIASADAYGQIKIWDGPTNPKILRYGGLIRALVALSDGRLASGGDDGNIKVWPRDLKGEPVTLRYGAPVQSLAALDDGRLASLYDDKEIKLWLVDDDKLLAELCMRAGRNLSESDWGRFIGANTKWKPSCRELPTNWQ